MINERQFDFSDACSLLSGEFKTPDGSTVFCLIIANTKTDVPSFNLCMPLDVRDRFIQFWKGHDDAP